MTEQTIIWSPRGNLAQVRLLSCPVFEVFFGRARGGGKTDGVLGEFGSHASRYGKTAEIECLMAAGLVQSKIVLPLAPQLLVNKVG
jgi:hypothetical protein